MSPDMNTAALSDFQANQMGNIAPRGEWRDSRLEIHIENSEPSPNVVKLYASQGVSCQAKQR